MIKKIGLMLVLLSVVFMLTACDGDDGELKRNGEQDNGNGDVDPIDNNPNGDDPNGDDPSDNDPPVFEGTHVASGSIEKKQTVEHTLVIETRGVYEIFSKADFDAVGIVFDANGDQLKRDGWSGDFLITLFLEPGTYTVEVRAVSINAEGDYELHVNHDETFADVYYYVMDGVSAYDVNEHAFSVHEAGLYRIVGDSETNLQGTLYNKTTGNYLTTDYDLHTSAGFEINYTFEPGEYEIHIRGYDWSAGDYVLMIYQD